MTLKYRPDIDGLRALAVSAVVAYHAGVPWLKGGFTGVDSFFVISGFLITGLLISEHAETGRINLPAFWARRARRLAPAFLCVVAAILIAAPFMLQRISGETGALAKAAIASILINANHYFLSLEGDYFGAAAETNPLLHMWSLSVEEQFYLAWPLMLALLWRSRSPTSECTQKLFAVITLASFLAACWLTKADAKLAFYLTPARAWELVAGGLLALFLHNRGVRELGRHGTGLGLAGGVLLVLSFVCLDSANGFPGPMALFPVAGTLMLLLAGALAPNSWVSRGLRVPWVVYLGKISYPLYLWHWPVLVLFRSNRLYEPSLAHDLFAVLISLLLAVVTYEVVEKGLWRRFTHKPRTLRVASPVYFALTGASLCLMLAVALGAWARFGWAYSAEEGRLNAARHDMPPLECMFQAPPGEAAVEACLGDTRKPTVLLWGDSHANHWRPALTRAVEAKGINLATLTMNACRPLPGPVGTPDCVTFNSQMMQRIRNWKGKGGLVGVIVSARWPEGAGIPAPSIVDAAAWKPGEYFDARAHSTEDALRFLDAGMNGLAHELSVAGIRLLIVGPSPVQRFAAVHCLALRAAGDCGVQSSVLGPYVSPAVAVIRDVAKRNRNVRELDPLAFMCNAVNCPVVSDGVIIYSDDDHITQTYSIAQASRFSDAMGWMASIHVPPAGLKSQGAPVP